MEPTTAINLNVTPSTSAAAAAGVAAMAATSTTSSTAAKPQDRPTIPQKNEKDKKESSDSILKLVKTQEDTLILKRQVNSLIKENEVLRESLLDQQRAKTDDYQQLISSLSVFLEDFEGLFNLVKGCPDLASLVTQIEAQAQAQAQSQNQPTPTPTTAPPSKEIDHPLRGSTASSFAAAAAVFKRAPHSPRPVSVAPPSTPSAPTPPPTPPPPVPPPLTEAIASVPFPLSGEKQKHYEESKEKLKKTIFSLKQKITSPTVNNPLHSSKQSFSLNSSSSPAVSSPPRASYSSTFSTLPRLPFNSLSGVLSESGTLPTMPLYTVLDLEDYDEQKVKKLQRAWRRYKNIHAFHNLVNSYKTSKLSYHQRLRNQVLRELLSTERAYVESLNLTVEKFYKPLVAEMENLSMTQEEISEIFGKLDIIRNVNINILSAMEKEYEKWPYPIDFSKIFITMAPYLKIYTEYVNNYENALAALQRSRDKKRNFRNWLKKVEDDPDLHGLALNSYLIKPVQRVPRYVLLLQDLGKHVQGTEQPQLGEALEKLQEVAKHINEKKRWEENTQRLFQIQTAIHGSSFQSLVKPGRFLVREGELSVVSERGVASSRVLFLCNDIIFWVEKTIRGGFNFEKCLNLNDFEIREPEEGSDDMFELHASPSRDDPTASNSKVVYRFLCTGGSDEKAGWMRDIGRSQAQRLGNMPNKPTSQIELNAGVPITGTKANTRPIGENPLDPTSPTADALVSPRTGRVDGPSHVSKSGHRSGLSGEKDKDREKEKEKGERSERGEKDRERKERKRAKKTKDRSHSTTEPNASSPRASSPSPHSPTSATAVSAASAASSSTSATAVSSSTTTNVLPSSTAAPGATASGIEPGPSAITPAFKSSLNSFLRNSLTNLQALAGGPLPADGAPLRTSTPPIEPTSSTDSSVTPQSASSTTMPPPAAVDPKNKASLLYRTPLPKSQSSIGTLSVFSEPTPTSTSTPTSTPTATTTNTTTPASGSSTSEASGQKSQWLQNSKFIQEDVDFDMDQDDEEPSKAAVPVTSIPISKPTSELTPTKSGWLLRLTGFPKFWRLRWFQVTETSLLKCYKSPNDKEFTDSLLLNTVTSIQIENIKTLKPPLPSNYKFCLTLYVPQSTGPHSSSSSTASKESSKEKDSKEKDSKDYNKDHNKSQSFSLALEHEAEFKEWCRLFCFYSKLPDPVNTININHNPHQFQTGSNSNPTNPNSANYIPKSTSLMSLIWSKWDEKK